MSEVTRCTVGSCGIEWNDENKRLTLSRDNWKDHARSLRHELADTQALAAWFAAERDYYSHLWERAKDDDQDLLGSLLDRDAALDRVRALANDWPGDYCVPARSVLRALDGEGQS